jgi:3-deoxy-D-manno-octulosonic-acid transferase
LRRVYTSLFYLCLPFVLLRIVYLGFRRPGYWQRWGERFGFAPIMPSQGPRIWVHAVSVGEVQAATPLIEALERNHPHLDIVLTTTAPAGDAHAARLLAGRVTQTYMPYDLPDVIGRFLKQVKPDALIIMEIELWPNLLHYCCQRHIPVILANARLPQKSVGKYQRLARLTREILSNFSLIAAQTPADAKRFLDLGADPAKVTVTGSLKFDVKPAADVEAKARRLRGNWGEPRPVWMAASTHEGEETTVLEAHQRILKELPHALLLLAPRQPDRAGRVHDFCKQRGLSTVRRTEGLHPCPENQVFLIDTLGELPLFYGASDVAFVGGSLVATGGHNPLEPGSLGVPILTGPHVFNFREIYDLFIEAEAARVVDGPEQLTAHALEWLTQPESRRAAGERGRTVVEAHRGATERLLRLMAPYLPFEDYAAKPAPDDRLSGL